MKKAFTLIELVFVIVIIGIIVATIIPRTNTNKLQEAAIQLVSHIRYTQHLAMIDDKYDANNPNWYKERWQLIFQMNALNTQGKYAYTIFSDKLSTTGTAHDGIPNTTNGEIAFDPSNNDKYLSGGTTSLDTSSEKANKKMNLGLSYGIDSYALSGGCESVRIVFDHLGRPIVNNINAYTSSYRTGTVATPRLINSTCIITLTSSSEGSVAIHIEPETGYAHIVQI